MLRTNTAGMGGLWIDRTNFCPTTRWEDFPKRWYIPLVSYLIDVSIHNAWVLCREILKKNKKTINQKEFRIKLSKQLLENTNRKRRRENTIIEGLHIPVKVEMYAKCSCGCGSKTPYKCHTCGCFLVAAHFFSYHSKLAELSDDEENE